MIVIAFACGGNRSGGRSGGNRFDTAMRHKSGVVVVVVVRGGGALLDFVAAASRDFVCLVVAGLVFLFLFFYED